MSARMDAVGADYTVTVSRATDVGALEIANVPPHTATVSVQAPLRMANSTVRLGTGARVTVPEDGRVTHQQPAFETSDVLLSERDCDRVMLGAGSEWTVAGGTTVLTNFLGRLRVAGTESASGRLTVTGGSFDFFPAKTTWSRMVLDDGGEISLSGGRTRLIPADFSSAYVPIIQQGGVLDVSGTAVLEFGQVRGHIFGTGVTRFRGSSTLTTTANIANGVKFYVGPVLNATTSRVEFVDSAKLWTEKYATITMFQLGYDQADSRAPMWTPVTQGLAVLDYASDAYSRFGSKIAIGSDYCRGEAYLRAGLVSVHYFGVDVGGFTEGQSQNRRDARGDGHLVIAGGALSCEANNRDLASRRAFLDGLIVGAGQRTQPGSASFYRGRLDLSSGALTNRTTGAFVVVGAGQASGEFVQTGGMFVNAAPEAFPMVIGFEGGTGLYALTNGTAQLSCDLYVGGVTTNTLNRFLAPYCPHRHDATGRLVLAGGTLTVARDVIVSADGFGTVEVGPNGSLTARNLILSNGTEAASTAALTFAVAADGQTGTVALSERLTIRPGATLVVDFSDYTGDRSTFPLVSCTDLDGSFAEENITVTGLNATAAALARVIQDRTGVRVGVLRGTVLTFR